MQFVKYHGAGNSFVLLEWLDNAPMPSPEWVQRVCSTDFGIGADGILFVCKPTTEGADLQMRIINSDGSEAEMCGNGVRIFAMHVIQRGLAQGPVVRVETGAGMIITELVEQIDELNALVKVDMGSPQTDGELKQLDVGEVLEYTQVSMGNPHTVIVGPYDTERIETIGPRVQANEAFPESTNVGFLEVLGPAEGRLTVYERGVGITQACGTGACGATTAGIYRGLFQPGQDVTMHMPGGDLILNLEDHGGRIWMTGPATKVAEGTLSIPM